MTHCVDEQQTACEDFADRCRRDDDRVGRRFHLRVGAQHLLPGQVQRVRRGADPGSGSLYLPAGEVTVSLHTVVISGPDGGGLPVPPLGVTITPPDGLAQPTMSENIGSTTTVNNDAHVRVWVAQIPTAGTYNITTDGQVNGFIDASTGLRSLEFPRLSGVVVRGDVRCGPGRFDRLGVVAGPHPAQGGSRGGAGGSGTRAHVVPVVPVPSPYRRLSARTNPPTRASGSSGSKRWRRCGIPER